MKKWYILFICKAYWKFLSFLSYSTYNNPISCFTYSFHKMRQTIKQMSPLCCFQKLHLVVPCHQPTKQPQRLNSLKQNELTSRSLFTHWGKITKFDKGLRNLAIWDSQEWQETAHVKSYGVDTSPKCTKYIFPYENGSSLLIK